MVNGILTFDELPLPSNNLLNEFCNFNSVHTWNKTAGGSNATIINNVGGRHSYLGLGSVSINFTGASQVSFNAGATQMSTTIQRDGNYILSFAFDKSDPSSDITFIVEMFVNGVLQPTNTITQNLYSTSGYQDGKWNTYFQSMALAYGDVVDFAFKAQSDTTSCYLYFDRLKLEIDDRGNGLPTTYTEAPLTIYEKENTLTIGAITAGQTKMITASLPGATVADNYIGMKYPAELNTLGLIVGYPTITADEVVKFAITNTTGSTITPTADGIYNFKVLR